MVLAVKTLLLIRHAKSSWDDPRLPDHDRPLNRRGLSAAPLMGQRLRQRGVRPDLWLSSSALRALNTAQLIADQLEHPRADISIEPGLYAATQDDLARLIAELPNDRGCVALFGHNPAFEQLAEALCPSIQRMPTCAVAEFEFAAEQWSRMMAARPLRSRIDLPKRAADECRWRNS